MGSREREKKKKKRDVGRERRKRVRSERGPGKWTGWGQAVQETWETRSVVKSSEIKRESRGQKGKKIEVRFATHSQKAGKRNDDSVDPMGGGRPE